MSYDIIDVGLVMKRIHNGRVWSEKLKTKTKTKHYAIFWSLPRPAIESWVE